MKILVCDRCENKYVLPQNIPPVQNIRCGACFGGKMHEEVYVEDMEESNG